MVIGPALHGILINMFKDPITKRADKEAGYLFSISVLTIMASITFMTTIISVKENENIEDEKRPKISFFKGFKVMLTNKAFICIMLIYLFSFLTLQFVQNNLLLYIKYVLNLESYFSFILLCFLSVSAMSLPVWASLAKRYEKKIIYLIGGIFLGTFFFLFLF